MLFLLVTYKIVPYPRMNSSIVHFFISLSHALFHAFYPHVKKPEDLIIWTTALLSHLVIIIPTMWVGIIITTSY